MDINITIILIACVILLVIQIKNNLEAIIKRFKDVVKENIFTLLPLFLLILVKVLLKTLDTSFFTNSNFMLIILIFWSNILFKNVRIYISIYKSNDSEEVIRFLSKSVLGIIASGVILTFELISEENKLQLDNFSLILINLTYFINTFILLCQIKEEYHSMLEFIKNEKQKITSEVIECKNKIKEIDKEISDKNKENYDENIKDREEITEIIQNNKELISNTKEILEKAIQDFKESTTVDSSKINNLIQKNDKTINQNEKRIKEIEKRIETRDNTFNEKLQSLQRHIEEKNEELQYLQEKFLESKDLEKDILANPL